VIAKVHYGIPKAVDLLPFTIENPTEANDHPSDLAGDTICMDEVLIREGLTMDWTRDGQHRDYLVGLELERAGKMGGVFGECGGRWDFQKMCVATIM